MSSLPLLKNIGCNSMSRYRNHFMKIIKHQFFWLVCEHRAKKSWFRDKLLRLLTENEGVALHSFPMLSCHFLSSVAILSDHYLGYDLYSDFYANVFFCHISLYLFLKKLPYCIQFFLWKDKEFFLVLVSWTNQLLSPFDVITYFTSI